MATPLDTTLIQLFTGGVNMPTQAQAAAGYVPRAAVDGAGRVNLEYVAPSTFGSNVANVVDYGAAGDGVTNDAAAFTAAIAAGKPEVFIPEGVFLLSTAVTTSVANLTVTFAPGAVVLLASSGSLAFSGRGVRLNRPTLRFNSAVSGVGLKVTGENSAVYSARFENNADNVALTCLKIEGDSCTVRDVVIMTEAKSLAGGIKLETAAAGLVKYVVVEGVAVDLGDPTAEEGDKTYGAMVHMHAQYSMLRDYNQSTSGGRTLFPSGIFIVDGQKNAFENVKAFLAYGATYGIVLKENSEFFSMKDVLISGRNNGTYVANSAGILCEGNFAGGHSKWVEVIITGFTNGVVMKGGADTPTWVGVSIANNDEYGVVIDTAAAGGLTISNWSCVSCYFGDVTQERNFHFLSGDVQGMSFTSCQIGIKDGQVGFYVDPTFARLGGVVFTGCRLIGASGGSSEFVFEPNVNTGDILIINPVYHSIAAFGTGTYADKCIDVMINPTFTGAIVGANGLKIGTDGSTITKHLSQSNTANYGAGVAAGATVTLTFAMTGVLTTDSVQVTLTTNHATSGLIYTPYVTTADEIGLRAFNPTLVPIGATTGSVRFDVFRH